MIKDPLKKPQVLVIDDDLDLLETLSCVLDDLGYDVVSYGNGLAALDWLQDHRPSIILVDLMMPIMTGQEFIREKDKLDFLKNIPTLVMSASSNLESEYTSFIRKPFNFKMLKAIIDRTMSH